ncbi:MAG: hypothetical protein ACYC2H_04640 [Thermoplasmatota archaeon]
MRWFAAAALAALLSGCTVPTDEPAADPLFGLCPQWAEGPGRQVLDLALPGGSGNATNATATRDVELGPANATLGGRPLDLYRVRLDRLAVDGRLELRAFAADGRQLAVRDYRQVSPQLVPVVVFTDGSAAGDEFEVFLSPVGHDDAGSPAPVTLRWTADGNATVAATVTYHYKVCGAEL